MKSIQNLKNSQKDGKKKNLKPQYYSIKHRISKEVIARKEISN